MKKTVSKKVVKVLYETITSPVDAEKKAIRLTEVSKFGGVVFRLEGLTFEAETEGSEVLVPVVNYEVIDANGLDLNKKSKQFDKVLEKVFTAMLEKSAKEAPQVEEPVNVE